MIETLSEENDRVILEGLLARSERLGEKSLMGDASRALYRAEAASLRRLLDAARASSPAPPGEGSDPVNDTKYAFRDGRVWNRADGLPIPDEEPVMVFRARDKHATNVIAHYHDLLPSGEHRQAVDGVFKRFQDFAYANPNRMKEPDTGQTASPPHPRGGTAAFRSVVCEALARGAFPQGEASDRVVQDFVDRLLALVAPPTLGGGEKP